MTAQIDLCGLTIITTRIKFIMDVTKPFCVNVGGRIFTTTKDTLRKCDFFKALLDNTKDEIEVFIDRDSDAFVHILRHLRNPDYLIPEEWASEWEFYHPQCPDRKTEESVKKFNTDDGMKMYHVLIREKFTGVFGVKFFDWIITLDPLICSNGRTVFKIPPSVDEVLHPIFDYTHVGGQIKAGGMNIPFGGNVPFVRVCVGVLPFHEIKIEINSNLKELKVLVRTILDRDEMRKKMVDLVDKEHNIVYTKHHSLETYWSEAIWNRPEEILKKYNKDFTL